MGRIAAFEAFGRRIVGAKDGLVETFTREPLDHEDVEAVQAAFPKLWARYGSMKAKADTIRSRLFTYEECRRLIQRTRVLLALCVALVGTVCVLLSWYGGFLVTAGFVAAFIAWAYRTAIRRNVGGFISRARSVGNATQLVGEVDVAVVCVRPSGTRGIGWDEGEVGAALTLLRNEAHRHGVDLSFRRVEEVREELELPSLLGRFDAYDPEALQTLKLVVDAATPRRNGFVLVLTTEHACTPTAWVRSRWADPSTEFCVCPRNASAETIAHEVLHLFGAQDLYVSERTGSMTWGDILDDVTGYVHDITGEDITQTSLMTNLDDAGLSVDPITAAAIGWTDRVAGHRVPLFGRSASPDAT